MKKLAIVGSHSRTRDAAPWDDLNTRIWIFNEAAGQAWCKRWDACFQMHVPAVYRSEYNTSDPRHWAWLQDIHPQQVIYMQAVDGDVPASRRYPLESIQRDLLGNFLLYDVDGGAIDSNKYFRATVCYAMALGIWSGFDEIDLYGIEAGSNTEYFYQRDCLTFWLGLAVGYGVRVNLHCAESIFDTKLYGYDGNLEISLDAYDGRIRELTNQVEREQVKLDLAKKRAEESLTPEHLKAYTDRVFAHAVASGALGAMKEHAARFKDIVEQDGTALLDRTRFEAQAADALNKYNAFRDAVQSTAGVINHAFESRNGQLVLSSIPSHIDACFKYGFSRGVYEENTRLVDDYDARLQAAGGDKALQALQKRNRHKRKAAV